MKIDSISPNTSKAEPKVYLNHDMHKNIKSLMQKMKNSTNFILSADGNSFTSDVLASVTVDKIKFTDLRFILAPAKKFKNYPYDCTIETGKASLYIDSETGEIIQRDKPFFKTWKTLMENISNAISEAVINFEDSGMVKKGTFPIAGLTAKGYARLSKYA